MVRLVWMLSVLVLSSGFLAGCGGETGGVTSGVGGALNNVVVNAIRLRANQADIQFGIARGVPPAPGFSFDTRRQLWSDAVSSSRSIESPDGVGEIMITDVAFTYSLDEAKTQAAGTGTSRNEQPSLASWEKRTFSERLTSGPLAGYTYDETWDNDGTRIKVTAKAVHASWGEMTLTRDGDFYTVAAKKDGKEDAYTGSINDSVGSGTLADGSRLDLQADRGTVKSSTGATLLSFTFSEETITLLWPDGRSEIVPIWD